MHTTDGGKALYEALEALSGLAGGLGQADVERVIDAIKRSMINPQGSTARYLLTAVTRYENVRSVVVPRYDDHGR